MATNLVHDESAVIPWANGTGSPVSSGDIVWVAGVGAGLALVDIADGARGSVRVRGEVVLPKSDDTGPVFAEGDPVYVVLSTQLATTNNGTGLYVGRAMRAAATDEGSVRARIAPLSDAPAGVWTAAATGAQTVPAVAWTPRGLVVEVPNTAALTVTLPVIRPELQGSLVTVRKTAAAAQAVTPAAGSGNTIVGTIGTIDANNDRTVLQASGTTLVHLASVIA